MGFGEWLSNARLSYHGYTPEYMQRVRDYNAQKEQERQWREQEDRRRLQLAEESGKRAADAATAAAERQRQQDEEDRDKSVYEQLKLLPDGADVTKLMGVEGVPVGRLQQLQERVRQERGFAQAQADAKRAREAEEKRAEDAKDQSQRLLLHRRYKEIDREFDTPKPATDEKIDPFLARATRELDDMQTSGLIPPALAQRGIDPLTQKPTTTIDPAKADSWLEQRASQLRALNRRVRGDGGAAAPAPAPAATAPSPVSLTTTEQAAISKLSPDDQAKIRAILASGNLSAITKVRQGLNDAKLAR